jgi:hypothetical protein
MPGWLRKAVFQPVIISHCGLIYSGWNIKNQNQE